MGQRQKDAVEMDARIKPRYEECASDMGQRIEAMQRVGCTNHAKNGGVCIRHGAKVKLCSKEGCAKGGVCKKHGVKINAK